MVEATAYLRRSFVRRKLEAAGARFAEVAGAAVAASFANATDELATARVMGLADLSPLPRCGFKGAGTADWLAAQGLAVPPEPNRATAQADGSYALRLAANEVFLLGDLGGAGRLGRDLNEAWKAAGEPPSSPRGWPLPRQETHCWFLATGRHGAEMFAKICGVDLRPAHFPDGHLAQTSVAKMSAIVARQDLGGTLAYHLVCDSASADYMWTCVTDAMAEFGGGPVGLEAVRALAAG